MQSQVLKYPLAHGALIELREGFIARHVGDQMGTVCMWAEVFPALRMRTYRVAKLATGDIVPSGAMYLGTVLESHGMYVWHYYAVQA